MEPDPQNQEELQFGPIDMYDFWADNIGEEWALNPPDNEPLNPWQMKYLMSESFRNVEFGPLLGSGAFAKVYQVSAETPNELTHVWERNLFACKVIRHKTPNMESVKTSLGDMTVLRYLRHKNICNLLDVFGIPDSITKFPYAVVCIFLEYCHGDLNKIRLEGKKLAGKRQFENWVFPEQLSKHWFTHIAKGLDYIHENSVAHRDIKQQNILFHSNNLSVDTFEDRFLSSTFKLADFGISRVQLTSTKQHTDAQNGDIVSLLDVLYSTGVPGPRGYATQTKFFDKCISGNWTADDPKDWNTISLDMKDLMAKMANRDNRLSASLIAQHHWLENDEQAQSARRYNIISRYRPDSMRTVRSRRPSFRTKPFRKSKMMTKSHHFYKRG